MTVEKWRPIPGWPDYEVSSLGRVMSSRRRLEPRELRGNVNEGYRFIKAYGDGGVVRNVAVHRAVAAAFLGPRPAGMEVRHLDGDGLNNRLDNLAYGTKSENARDTLVHGTHPQASKTHCKRGHEFSADNTWHYRGGRYCRSCKRFLREQAVFAAANIKTTGVAA